MMARRLVFLVEMVRTAWIRICFEVNLTRFTDIINGLGKKRTQV